MCPMRSFCPFWADRSWQLAGHVLYIFRNFLYLFRPYAALICQIPALFVFDPVILN